MNNTPQQHRRQAEENKASVPALIGVYPLWATVVAFYAAMHYVNQYAALTSRHFKSHWDRQDWIQNRPELAAIVAPYLKLYENSRIARYDCPHQNHHVRKPDYIQKKMLHWLNDVVQGVDAAIQQQGSQPTSIT
jgi:hypothetical protein